MTTLARTNALAFRIWAAAQAVEWNCTAQELAQALGESAARVGAVLKIKGWHNRLRVAATRPTRFERGAGQKPLDEDSRDLEAYVIADVVGPQRGGVWE